MSPPAGATGLSRWVVREAYPLYGLVGAALVAFSGMIAHKCIYHPELSVNKQRRQTWFLETDKDYVDGQTFKQTMLRKIFSAAPDANPFGLFPNHLMSQPAPADLQ